MWNNEPWACFSKDPSGKWQFDGFVEVEELAVEFEQLHMTEDDKPTGFTCQMPDLGSEEDEPPVIKEFDRFEPLVRPPDISMELFASLWHHNIDGAMSMHFCGLTDHKVEVCVIPHHPDLGYRLREASKHLGEG